MKYALRRLTLTPGFTVATLITLALGIGANTAIFNIINSVLLKPLPFHEPDRLIGVWQTAPGLTAAAVLSRLMSALLFEISPLDPFTYTVAAVGILAAATVASYLPARRVTRVDPIEALRAE
jgi:ABC-type antimicrobial peptide transport system permease subunit